MKILFLLIFILQLVSCSQYTREVDNALSFSGDNRAELEKVLTHYEGIGDELKYQAAMFLIANMPGHYSYDGGDILKYYDEIDLILSDGSIPINRKKDTLQLIAARHPNLNKKVIEDIKIMTAKYLIDNIDAAFKLWDKPWARHLSFSEFCETLLPYKCIEYQQLDYWRDSLDLKFINKLDHGYDGDNLLYPIEHYKSIFADIQAKMPQSHDLGKLDYYRPMRASNISLLKFGNCEDYADVIIAIMRSKGVPIVKEYFPMWGSWCNAGHIYYSILNKSGIYVPTSGYGSNPGEPPLLGDASVPKIYRQTYSYNKERKEYYENAKYIHGSINVFDNNVTDKYCTTSDLSIPINTKGLKDKYVYISVFNGSQWEIIDFGTIKRSKAVFTKMGRNNVYMTFGYNGAKLVPISVPFILENRGDIRYLDCNVKNTETVKLYRKYIYTDDLKNLEDRCQGGIIHASDHVNFKIYDSITYIEIPGAFAKTNTDKSYQYWRLYPKPDAWCNIAELQFYEFDSTNYSKGRVITNIKELLYDGYLPEYAFDGDWLTNSHGNQPSDCWIGLDFGRKVSIERVLCVPRSDDNNIRIGDKYELKCWINGQWTSLGIQIAEDTPLVYHNVPCNSILWLSNLTRGVQERIFTYENNRQVWR